MRNHPFYWYKILALFILSFFSYLKFYAQSDSTPDPGEKYYSIFLIGDAGEVNEKSLQIFKNLKGQMTDAGSKSATLFLGDNIYPLGMPDEDDKTRDQAEQILKTQLDLVVDYKGKSIMIPGNHDWKKGRKDGLNRQLYAEEFATEYLKGKKTIYPGNACPGPSTFELTEDILLVVYDSQWFLHPHDRPGENESCGAKTGLEAFAQLQEIVKLNGHKKIILAAHHPIYTYGMHGGKSNFRQHVFPLTDAQKSLYLPLPIVGSLYPLYRKFLGNVQDVSHPMNTVLRRAIRQLVEMHPNIIHASGHEHSLQYSTRNDAHYVVSGSGSRTSHVEDGKYSEFTAERFGYSRLDFYSSGAVKVVFFSPNEGQNEILFEKELFTKAKRPDPYQIDIRAKSEIDNQTIVTHVSDQYEAGKGSERWFGTNYRDVWKTNVELPVFDIGTEHGGLEIVQRGGGFQTKSLRLEAGDGKQYVLRSIEKYTSKAIPKVLRGSFAADVVQDQISAAHPYGAFVVPHFAENAGIYHTNPKPVFIPDDRRFGRYREEFANTVVLYEERPSGSWEDSDFFGKSTKIINTDKMIKSLKKDNDNHVDQEFVLRNRLFDLFIADWDRHEDQWRWASFKEKKGKMYRPIPRDRDQAFFVNQGILPKIASRKWAMPKFQGFDFDLKNVPGFMFNARWFDRSFMNEPDKDTWIKTAEDLKTKMSDQVIEDALKKWPDSVYLNGGELVGRKLQSRRDKLTEWALSYYSFLSEKVDVVGSDKQEFFDIERVSNGDTKVTVYKLNKDGEKKKELYSRLFIKNETKEIRLYGLGGKDRFQIHGNAKSAIKTRIIGGKGKDSITDISSIRGWGRSTLIYDTKKGSYIEKGKESRNLTSTKPEVNEYNRKAFRYNLTLPLLIGNYNVDDGVFVGGGMLRTTHGFRKEPYKSRHLFLAMAAIKTGSFDFRYKGIYNRVIGSLDITGDIDLEGPNYALNYFGMGNESVYDQNQNIDYYRVRFDNVLANLYLRKRFTEDFKISLGAKYENINVRENSNRYLSQEAISADTVYENQRYLGPSLKIELDTRDNTIMPHKGLHLMVDGKAMNGLNGFSNDYNNLTGSFAFYWSFREPSAITISNRTGGGFSSGDFEFYQANTLGGSGKTANLRGYRRTRFYGQTSFYNNAEIRFTLFGFRTYLFPSHFGILAFHDIGRVWLEGEDSNKWHQSLGGGIWMSPFEAMVLSASIAVGEEESLLIVKFGFLF